MKHALHRIFHAGLVLALAVLSAPSSFGQGALTPPPGPPGPTMKTLAQIGPRVSVDATHTPGDANNTFIISAPGSYYFAGNLTGAPSKSGISIQADDVTLDLNGFALISGGGAARSGVVVAGTRTNLLIRNGGVRGWGGDGVVVGSSASRVEKLRLSNNAGIGLYVGTESIVDGCVANNNLIGFFGAAWSQFTHCIATVNTGDGFHGLQNVTIIDSTSSRNGGIGILIEGAGSILHCSVSRSVQSGIVSGDGSTVEDCLSATNGVRGISVSAASTVRNCTARGNPGPGIYAITNCIVLENTCNANGGQGILTFGGGNRIEGNDCSANGIGFDIDASSLLITNSAHGNGSNFNLQPATTGGPIVDMTAGGIITSTVPTANFAY